MSEEKISYIYNQMKKGKIDHIVKGDCVYSALEDEEFVPVMVEGVLYVELRRNGNIRSGFNFWTIDEVHYVDEDESISADECPLSDEAL